MKLYQRIAEQIARDFAAVPDGVLPSMGELAAKYGVSRPTLLKAAHALRDRGVVAIAQGRRMRLMSGDAPNRALPDPTFTPSARRFADSLAQRIANGVYRSGQELPKQTYFASEYGISIRTVRKGYQILVDRGLMYRRGRGWAAGRPVRKPSVEQRRQRSMIAIAVRSLADWHGLQTQGRSEKFIEAFTSEAESFGVDIVTAVHDEERGEYVVPAIVDEPRPLARLVRELGTAYLGTLILNNRYELPDVEVMIGRCLALGRTVWYDRSGINIDAPPPGRQYARCHYSEEAVVGEALKVLADFGHRTIAYIRPAGNEPWVFQRGATLAKLGSSMTPPQRVLLIEPGGEYQPGSRAEGFRDRLASFCERFPAFDRRFRELVAVLRSRGEPLFAGMDVDYTTALASIIHIIRKRGGTGGLDGECGTTARLARITPMMMTLMSNRDVTALVVPRDIYAYRCIQWLAIAGVRVPRDLSVISFDNTFHRIPTSLASIDPGFNHLGYSAFHFLFGDIRPRRDAHGNLPVRPTVSRWGTLSPARRGPLPRRGRSVMS
jgi:DNA-binding GntR family transcriptional regulator